MRERDWDGEEKVCEPAPHSTNIRPFFKRGSKPELGNLETDPERRWPGSFWSIYLEFCRKMLIKVEHV